CGATYPDIAQMLIQAEKGHNLEGRIELDALPRAGREYLRPKDDLAQVAAQSTRIGRTGSAPNMFPQAAEAGRDKKASAVKSTNGGRAEDAADSNAKLLPPKREDMLLRPETPWYDVRKYFLDPKTP